MKLWTYEGTMEGSCQLITDPHRNIKNQMFRMIKSIKIIKIMKTKTIKIIQINYELDVLTLQRSVINGQISLNAYVHCVYFLFGLELIILFPVSITKLRKISGISILRKSQT